MADPATPAERLAAGQAAARESMGLPAIEYPRLVLELELAPGIAGRAEATVPDDGTLAARLAGAGEDGLALLSEAGLAAIAYLLDNVGNLEPDDAEPARLLTLEEADAP